MKAFIVFLDNDNFVEVNGLKDAISGSFLNAASVTVHVRDTSGVDLADGPSGFTWPQTMVYVPNSDGIYRVTLDKSLSWVADTRYIATIISDESGADGQWIIDLLAKVRSY